MGCCSAERVVHFLTILGSFICIPFYVLSTPFRWIFEFFDVYHPDLFRRRNSPSNHLKKVQKVQQQVEEWNRNGRKKRICTARPTWRQLSLRELDKSKFTQIKIDLEDIIEIDTEAQVLSVEPGMKMGTLTYKLLSLGWTIPVLPELESLSIGGLVCGTGIETSSHKWGLFADTCLEFELVMADGSLVTCSKNTNSDLFYAISWSHGTIGFLTAVKIKLIPAAKYVRVQYHKTTSMPEAKRLLQRYEFDFLEGIAFALDKIVVMHGKFVERTQRSKVNYINRWYKPWFYKHVESMLKNNSFEPIVEYIPTRDYYHRHQRSYFWEALLAFPIGNNVVLRYLIGWIYPFNFSLSKRFGNVFPKIRDRILEIKRHVLQDFMVPFSKFEDILKLSHEEFEVYPIWLCPCKYFKYPGIARLSQDSDEDNYIDVGIYGMSPKKWTFDVETKIRIMEKFTIESKGFQFLYADTYMTREEFRKMFDLEHYDQIRKKYNCEDAFPEIYDKVSMNARR